MCSSVDTVGSCSQHTESTLYALSVQLASLCPICSQSERGFRQGAAECAIAALLTIGLCFAGLVVSLDEETRPRGGKVSRAWEYDAEDDVHEGLLDDPDFF